MKTQISYAKELIEVISDNSNKNEISAFFWNKEKNKQGRGHSFSDSLDNVGIDQVKKIPLQEHLGKVQSQIWGWSCKKCQKILFVEVSGSYGMKSGK